MNVRRLVLPTVITLGAGLLLGLIGCSKNNNNNTSTGTMSCTVNGTAFSAQPYQVGAGYLSNYGQLFVVGYNIQNTDTSLFQVVMPYLPPVNVAFSTDTTISDLAYVKSGQEYDAFFGFDNSHGIITLSEADTVNHKVTGTFSGVLYNKTNSADSVVVTNGAFSSYYTIQ